MKLIITAGGTSEPIDKVRKITNMSQGTLGRALAKYADVQQKIEKIYYLSPLPVEDVSNKVVWIQTHSTQHVYDHLRDLLTTEEIDVVIHAMAVSDYTVDYVYNLEDMVYEVLKSCKEKMMRTPEHLRSMEVNHSDFLDAMELVKKGEFRLDSGSKISSKSEDLCIKLTPTQKIIGKIKEWSPETLLVGFKLLENVTKEELLRVASELKEKNKCDYVFANDIRLIREGGHQGYFLTPSGEVVDLFGKEEIAKGILDRLVAE